MFQIKVADTKTQKIIDFLEKEGYMITAYNELAKQIMLILKDVEVMIALCKCYFLMNWG